jgi:hypothetical protein
MEVFRLRLGKTVKRILALGTGAAFMGATILGATAAVDLSQFPQPFVQDGKFNAVMVYGDSAAAADVVGATELAMSLQYASRIKVALPSGTGSSTTVADSVKIETAGQKLYYNDSMNTVKQTLTSTDWPSVLKSGSITDNDGTSYTYTQQLITPQLKAKYSKSELDLASPVLFFNTQEGTYPQYAVQVDFPTPVNISRLYNKVIKIAGKEWTVGSANEQSTTSGAEKLTLYGGGLDTTLEAGEQKTVTVGSVEIPVSVTGVNTQAATATATIVVNGEAQSVTAGNTYVIGGIRVYVRDIMAYTAPQTSGKVRLFIGTNKVVFEQGSLVTTGDGSKDVDGVYAYFTNNGAGKVSRLTVNSTPYRFATPAKGLKIGDEVSDPLFGTFKMMFTGVNPALDSATRDVVKVMPTSSDKMSLSFTNKDGQKYDSIEFLQEGAVTATDTNTAGTDNGVIYKNGGSRDFVVDASAHPINPDDVFIINHNGYSHVLQLSSISNSTNSRKIKVKDLGGDTNEWAWTMNGTGFGGVGTMIYDGFTYSFDVSYDPTVANQYMTVDSAGSEFSGTLYTEHGAKLALPDMVYAGYGTNASTFNATFNLTEKTSYMDSKSPDDYGVFSIAVTGLNGRSGNKVRVADTSSIAYTPTVGSTGAGWVQDGNSGYNYNYLSAYGTLAKTNTDTSGGGAEFAYAGSEMSFDVFFAAEASAASTVGGSEAGFYYETQKVNVGSALLASEVAGKELSQNVILVGGPCANLAAAAVLGVTDPATCTSGFSEGHAKIKLIQGMAGQGNNVALLVAGMSAWDTRRAARVLSQADNYKDKLQGTEVDVVGVGQSFTDITVSPLTPV